MGETVFHREEYTNRWYLDKISSAMKASKKSTDNVNQGRDSKNKLPHKFVIWQNNFFGLCFNTWVLVGHIICQFY